MSTILAPRWYERALCRGYSELYFPSNREDGSHTNHAQALRICPACPVKRQCLELAMSTEGSAAAGARYGVFGGKTPAERRALWEARRKQAAA